MDEGIEQLISNKRYNEALEQLLAQYGSKVFRMAVAFLKNPARAEETTQDVFLKLWSALPHYDGRASPGTWLYAIARNTCLSASRSESYRKTLPLEDGAEPEVISNTDLELAQCLDRLPEIERRVITLFYLEDKQVREVALALGMPEGTVKSHLHRARLALAVMLKE